MEVERSEQGPKFQLKEEMDSDGCEYQKAKDVSIS